MQSSSALGNKKVNLFGFLFVFRTFFRNFAARNNIKNKIIRNVDNKKGLARGFSDSLNFTFSDSP